MRNAFDAIVFAGKKLAQFKLLEFVEKTRMFVGHFFFCMRALSRIVFLSRELLQRFEIFRRAFEFAKWIHKRAQSRDFFDFRLRAFAVRPEIGRAHARFERG